MSSKKAIPAWVEQARASWSWRGSIRPPFAIDPAPHQESVWDYPRPPIVVADKRHVLIKLGNVVIADSRGTFRLLETSHPPSWYVPRADIDMSHIERVSGSSFCEWKGHAEYFDVLGVDIRLGRAAWGYPNPIDSMYDDLGGTIAFYATNLQCFVNGEQVLPQAGGFYGGWITSDLCGPFKGDPGTSGW